MASITFPDYGKFQTAGYSHNAVPSVYRTPMESGPPKQARRQSTTLEEHTVSYIFSNDDYQTFLDWFHDTAEQGSLWFNWDNPITGSTVDGRIKDGSFRASPVSRSMTHWNVIMTIETYQ